MYDKNGNTLNANLEKVSPISPEAHVKIKELIDILEMR